MLGECISNTRIFKLSVTFGCRTRALVLENLKPLHKNSEIMADETEKEKRLNKIVNAYSLEVVHKP